MPLATEIKCLFYTNSKGVKTVRLTSDKEVLYLQGIQAEVIESACRGFRGLKKEAE